MKIILEGGFTLQRDLHRGVAALDYIVLWFEDVDVGWDVAVESTHTRLAHGSQASDGLASTGEGDHPGILDAVDG